MVPKDSDAKEAKDLAIFIDSQKWEDPRALLTTLILILGGTTMHLGLTCEEAQDLISDVIEGVYEQMDQVFTTKGMVMQ